jgi:hypothetical protein
MSSPKVRKITVSLPEEVVSNLDHISKKMRISRSALLSSLLASGLPGLVEVVDCMPDAGVEFTGSDARRLRGVSGKVIGAEISRLISGGQDDMF